MISCPRLHAWFVATEIDTGLKIRITLAETQPHGCHATDSGGVVLCRQCFSNVVQEGRTHPSSAPEQSLEKIPLVRVFISFGSIRLGPRYHLFSPVFQILIYSALTCGRASIGVSNTDVGLVMAEPRSSIAA